MKKITRYEIQNDLLCLISKVERFNKKCEPHSESDSWSGELYHSLCTASGMLATGKIENYERR